MKLANEQVMIQKQVMTQNQIMTVNFLALNNTEMQRFIQAEYDINPLIDHQNTKESDLGYHREQPSSRTSSGREFHDNDHEQDPDDSEMDMPMSEEHLVRLNVLMQLDREKFTSREWNVMSRMTDFLDEQGYLKIDLEDLANSINHPLKSVEKAYGVLSSLNPMGIFSGNVTEFLLKQLQAKDCANEKLNRLITEYSEDLAKGNLSKIARELRISGDELTKYLQELSMLKHSPIELSHAERSEYIVPDIIITGSLQSFEIALNDGWMGEYHYNDYYLNLLNTTTEKELKDYLTGKYQKSRFLFDCIEMRRETIIRIMNEITGLQGAFFFQGDELKPMTMEDIAVRVEMNISTVSRALKGKYIEYPFGCILAKKLFSQSIGTDSGEEQSKGQLEKLILAIINEEDKTRPLSDGQIEKLLKSRGILISRRTISKYRCELGILDSYNRKYTK